MRGTFSLKHSCRTNL